MFLLVTSSALTNYWGYLLSPAKKLLLWCVLELRSGVAFYDGTPVLALVSKFKADIQIHSVEKDAQHGFHSNTTPRYHEASTCLPVKELAVSDSLAREQNE